MTLSIRPFLLASLLLLCSKPAFSAEPLTMNLWPVSSTGENAAPGARGNEPGDFPRIAFFPVASEKPVPAVVIVPGGGYGGLASDHEGTQIAEWFNSMGLSAAICYYRHRNSGAGYGYPYPIMDAQRAIRVVRANAEQWNVDPTKVGIIGFSAGGHLATSVCTTDALASDVKDEIEQYPSRPDFAIICYPVIAFGRTYTHLGSQRNLLGDDVSQGRLDELSTDRRVQSTTPPTFLWHTAEDAVVLPQNASEYYQALIEHKVPAELHIFQKGRHGLGLAKGQPGSSHWPELCKEWLVQHGVLPND